MCAVVPLRNRSPVFLPAVATLATLKISHQLPTGGTIVQHESHRPAANSGLKNGPLTYRSRATDRTACVHRNTSWCRSHNNNNVLQVSASRQHSSATVLPLPPPPRSVPEAGRNVVRTAGNSGRCWLPHTHCATSNGARWSKSDLCDVGTTRCEITDERDHPDSLFVPGVVPGVGLAVGLVVRYTERHKV